MSLKGKLACVQSGGRISVLCPAGGVLVRLYTGIFGEPAIVPKADHTMDSPLHPAGLAPDGAYSQGQEAGKYGKGYTSSADGTYSTA